MSIIRTMTGDWDASQAGITLLHEHLLTNPPASVSDPDLCMDSVDLAVQELAAFAMAGGMAVVDMTTADYGRDIRRLQALAERSPVRIVAVTGWQKDKYSRAVIGERSINELTDELLCELQAGIAGSGIRAGVIKASSSLNTITSAEERALRAAARAQRETGVLISTHTEAGSMALEQVALLRAEGANPEKILIGHLDRQLDEAYHRAVLNTGVTIGYDQIGKEKYAPDATRVAFIMKLADAGYANQIALSGDMARRSAWPSYGNWGGPGLTYIPWRFAAWLREHGASPDLLEQLLIRTPRRLLAI